MTSDKSDMARYHPRISNADHVPLTRTEMDDWLGCVTATTDQSLHISDETIAEAERWAAWDAQQEEDDRRGWAAAAQLAASQRTPQQLCADFEALTALLSAPMPFDLSSGSYCCPVCRNWGDTPDAVGHQAWCRWQAAQAAAATL